MPNPIKYSASTQTLALKKGNYWIGTGDVGKGPTSTTDYWNGVTPPSGGYTIYLNKDSNGPSIYTAANDSQLISLSNTIAGQTFATAAAALAWFATQTDKMVFNIDYGPIVTDGLILNLDAGFTPSYPTTETTLYDLAIPPSISPANGTLLNGPTFNSANNGSLVFDGVDDQVQIAQLGFNNTTLNNLTAITVEIWIKPPTSPTQYGGYISRQTSANSNYTGWSIRQNNLNNGAIEWFGFGSNANMITGNVTPNEWTQVAGTWNGTVMTLYINGSQASTRTNSVNTISATGQVLAIGKLSYGNFPQTFSMASSRIYNRALTASEISKNYMAVLARFVTDSDTIAYINAVANNGGTITLTTAQKIQSFITYLKTGSPSGNQWQYLDRMWMFKNDSQQAALTSLRNPTSTMAETVNNPTFTVGAGFTLNGTNQYIKSNFIPSVNGSNFVFNGFFAGGMWQQTGNSTSAWEALFGVNDGTNEFLIFPNNNAFGTNYNMSRAIGGAYQNSNTSVTSGRVWYLIKRSGTSSTFERSNNDASDGGLSGGGNITKQIYIGAYNDNNTAVGSYWGKSNLKAMEFIFLGGSSMDMNELIYAVNTYLI